MNDTPTPKNLADAARDWCSPHRSPAALADIARSWGVQSWEVVANAANVSGPNRQQIADAIVELDTRAEGPAQPVVEIASDVEILRNALESICTLAREDNSLHTDAIHSIAAIALEDTA